MRVSGGGEGGGAGNGAQGFIRVEAFDLTDFTSNSNNTLSLGRPSTAILPNMPQIRIASVGGVAAPAQPSGSFHTLPDIIVPPSQANPVTVVIQATNIPNGSNVQVTLTPDSGTRTTVTTPLAGGNATVSLTLPTTGLSVITATTTYDVVVALGKPMFIEGERIDRVEVAATFGGASQLTFITRSGKRIKQVAQP
ncbi:MAG: hypothetical protein MSG64_10290 [Pyrinomonadaceae bacterium MAG19_C2-C3]|nr:hypothetical protein [Pyrinomonadaceae bacterium MAG19_C2-C3]